MIRSNTTRRTGLGDLLADCKDSSFTWVSHKINKFEYLGQYKDMVWIIIDERIGRNRCYKVTLIKKFKFNNISSIFYSPKKAVGFVKWAFNL